MSLEEPIILKTESPVAKKPYMLPCALQDKVKEEIECMLEAGIA